MRIAAIAIGAVVVVIGAGLTVMNFSSPGNEATDTKVAMEDSAMEVKDDTKSPNDDFTGTVTDLLKAGKNVTCTFKHTDENGTVEGTVYIAKDERLRSDVTMNNPQFGTMEAHIIRDTEFNYIWGLPTYKGGIKSPIDEDGKPMESDKDSGLDFDDEEIDYKCSTWRVDESKFKLPAGVEFMDISEQVKMIQESMGIMEGINCDACDQVPEGPGRDQCKKMMGC